MFGSDAARHQGDPDLRHRDDPASGPGDELPSSLGAAHLCTCTEPRRPTDHFKLGCHAPQGRAAEVEGLFCLIEHELQTNSIYRGGAITADGQFLDITSLDPESVVYSTETMAQPDSNVWSALRDTDLLRELGLSVKRWRALLWSALRFWCEDTCRAVDRPAGCRERLDVHHGEGWCVRPQRCKLRLPVSTLRQLCSSRTLTRSRTRTRLVPTLSVCCSDTFDGLQAKGKEILAVHDQPPGEDPPWWHGPPGSSRCGDPVGHSIALGVQRLIEVFCPGGHSRSERRLRPRLREPPGHGARVHQGGYRAHHALPRGCYRHCRSADNDGLLFAADGLRPQLEMMQNAPEHSCVPPPLEDTFSDLNPARKSTTPCLSCSVASSSADVDGDSVEIGDATGPTYQPDRVLSLRLSRWAGSDVILAFIVLQTYYRVAGVQQWGFRKVVSSRAERRFEEELLDELGPFMSSMNTDREPGAYSVPASLSCTSTRLCTDW